MDPNDGVVLFNHKYRPELVLNSTTDIVAPVSVVVGLKHPFTRMSPEGCLLKFSDSNISDPVIACIRPIYSRCLLQSSIVHLQIWKELVRIKASRSEVEKGTVSTNLLKILQSNFSYTFL